MPYGFSRGSRRRPRCDSAWTPPPRLRGDGLPTSPRFQPCRVAYRARMCGDRWGVRRADADRQPPGDSRECVKKRQPADQVYAVSRGHPSGRWSSFPPGKQPKPTIRPAEKVGFLPDSQSRGTMSGRAANRAEGARGGTTARGAARSPSANRPGSGDAPMRSRPGWPVSPRRPTARPLARGATVSRTNRRPRT